MNLKDLSTPISMGAVAALVGYTSSFAVVLAGLESVGATTAQATSGLIVLNLLQGIMNIWLSVKLKMPVMTAWSTPGAAILISTAAVTGGWAAAVGAFIVTGALIMLTGMWPMLGRLISLIPAPLAQAMLAGVLLTICIQPIAALAANPLIIAPVFVLWLILMRFTPKLATPAAFALALLIIAFSVFESGQGFHVPRFDLTPTFPVFTLPAIIGIAIPLFIVTMASQNVPGLAIMAAHGYQVPWGKSLVLTGASTVVGASFGAHALNLAAITAAMSASSGAHSDKNKRWIASTSSGITYIVLGTLTPLLTAAVALSPEGLIETVAGLALVTTMVAALADAFATSSQRIATGVTFLVAASPVMIFGIGAAFWGLVLGLVTWRLFK